MILKINTKDSSYTIDNDGYRINIEDLTRADTIFSEAIDSVMKAQPLILIEKPVAIPHESH
jgi:hypothetical protein